MLQEQRFWLLVSLKLSGEATPEEVEELNNLIAQNPYFGKRFEAVNDLWKAKNESSAEEKKQAFERHMQRLSENLSEHVLPNEAMAQEIVQDVPEGEKKGRSFRRLWWAGALAASVILCWVFFNAQPGKEPNRPDVARNTISTKPGSKTNIALPDGSKVWLNADSRITYSRDFGGSAREVYLSGEAYFEVAKDKKRPFIIHTQTVDLKVLGTAFNVRSYENEKETEAALVHGSLEVTLRSLPDKKIVLKPNEKLVVKNSSENGSNTVPEVPLLVLTRMRYNEDDSSVMETSWIRNRLVFESERLDEIALKIERWFNVKVKIKDTALFHGNYTGSFEYETLEDVMDALKLTGNFHYTIDKQEVIISP